MLTLVAAGVCFVSGLAWGAVLSSDSTSSALNDSMDDPIPFTSAWDATQPYNP